MPHEADLISDVEALAQTGYTTRHIMRLIRQGKIAGKKIGPIWLTTVEAVEVYRRSDPNPGPRRGSSRR